MKRRVVRIAILVGVIACSMVRPVDGSRTTELTFLICQSGGPDLKAEEQAIIRDFYNYIGGKIGLKAGGIKGEYQTQREKCLAALVNRPSVLMLSLDMFLASKQYKNLQPVAQIKIQDQTSSRYFLMSSVEGPKTVKALRGKQISGTSVGDVKFVSRIIMKGRLGPPQELVVEAKKFGLRAVRDVIRGKSSAVLLDEAQYRALRETPFEKQLQLVFISDSLPKPPITVDKRRVNPALKNRIQKILLSMSADPKGQKLLKTLGIDAFVSPEIDTWKKLEGMMK